MGLNLVIVLRTYGYELNVKTLPPNLENICKNVNDLVDMVFNSNSTKKGIIFGATLGLSYKIGDRIAFDYFLYFENYQEVRALK